MCEHCTPLTTQKFPSEQDFISFQKVLKTKLVDGTFIRVITAEDLPLEPRYQCTFCNTDWVLSVPERSIRGYFLPEQRIVEYENNETNNNFETFQGKAFQGKRSKNCGCCLGMILLFLGLIIYGLYSLVSFLFDLLF
jgi:hypothetical protein